MLFCLIGCLWEKMFNTFKRLQLLWAIKSKAYQRKTKPNCSIHMKKGEGSLLNNLGISKWYLTTVHMPSIPFFHFHALIKHRWLVKSVLSLLTSRPMKTAAMCLVPCFICNLGQEAFGGHSVHMFWIKLCWMLITSCMDTSADPEKEENSETPN